MTVSTDRGTVSYVLNGTDTRFDFNFYAILASNVSVSIYDDNTLTVLTYTEGTPSGLEYSVNLNANNLGGTITLGNAQSDIYTLSIYRTVGLTQTLDLNEGETFPAEDFEKAVDKIMMALQQQSDRLETE